jgi:hypothetical protein
MAARNEKDSTNDINDTRPMMMIRTASAATGALSLLIYVLFQILHCGCR